MEEEQSPTAPEAMGGEQPWGLSSREQMDGPMPGALGILLQVTPTGAAIPDFLNVSGGFPFPSPHSFSKDLMSSNPLCEIPSCWKHLEC